MANENKNDLNSNHLYHEEDIDVVLVVKNKGGKKTANGKNGKNNKTGKKSSGSKSGKKTRLIAGIAAACLVVLIAVLLSTPNFVKNSDLSDYALDASYNRSATESNVKIISTKEPKLIEDDDESGSFETQPPTISKPTVAPTSAATSAPAASATEVSATEVSATEAATSTSYSESGSSGTITYYSYSYGTPYYDTPVGKIVDKVVDEIEHETGKRPIPKPVPTEDKPDSTEKLKPTDAHAPTESPTKPPKSTADEATPDEAVKAISTTGVTEATETTDATEGTDRIPIISDILEFFGII